MNSFLAWIQAQAGAIWNTIAAVMSNSAEPARNTAVHLVAAVAVTMAVLAVIKKFSK